MTLPSLAGRRIMVVEDELLVSMLIEDTLTEQACVVVGPFTSLTDAMVAAKDSVMDGALLDVNLRGEKVYPVAEMLAARGIPFLLLSGYGADAVPSNHPDWEACSKPFRPAQLIGQLAKRLTGGAASPSRT